MCGFHRKGQKTPIGPKYSTSPASHDAANFAAAGIPTGLLLIRNAHGSHNPREAMEVDDLMAAAATFAAFLQG